VVGTGTVSADGKTIVSDGGVIKAPGWHFTISGTQNPVKIQPPVDTSGADDDSQNASNDLFFLIPLAGPPLEAALQTEVLAYAAAGAVATHGNPLTVVPYYNRYLFGDGSPDIESPGSTLSNEVRDDIQAAVGQQIQDQANRGAIDERNILLPEGSFVFTRGNLAFIVHGAQSAQATLTSFRAEGHIDSPETGGSGTWTAHLTATVGDEFGFGTTDISGPGGHGSTALDDLKQAIDSVKKGQFLTAAGFAKAALEQIAALDLSTDCYFLQHYDSAKAYHITIPVDVDISGTFTIPPGFEDVIVHNDLQAQSIRQPQFTTLSAPTPQNSIAVGFGTDKSVYYRYKIADGLEITGKIDPSGAPSDVILPPRKFFTATFYQPSSNRSAIVSGFTSASGEPTLFSDNPSNLEETSSLVNLRTVGGIDSDGDGIPDVGEYVLGTDPKKADTDGDGISDSAAIAQGLDPLGGKAFPTGVIANLLLAGPAEKVAVADNKVYVATGGHGLAVVDGSKFNQPVVLGQIELGGSPSDVGVDANLKIAAVATGQNLVLVDVSDPMTPKVLQSVAVAADRVVVANGLAYATSVTSLRVVDLQSGQVIQGLTLPGSGTITGLARDGSKLFAFVSGSDILSVIDISKEASAAVVGQVTVSIASSDVGIFAGNEVVWLAGSGLRTVDVSDPTKPKEIHDADTFFNARRIALNGSGLGLLTPDSGTFVQVYDTSDPTKTANLLTQFDLGDAARSVAISRGIGYVGTSKGLQVINYLPFDTKGKAPTVSVQADAVDLDPNTPGIQVIEGGTIPVRVNVSDDVQVRDVQLLVNGKVVADAVSFPFNFSAVALAGAPGASSVSIQAIATDTGGNSTLSDPVVVQLVPDTFPPTIVSIDPSDGAVRGRGTTTLRVRFSEPIDPAKFKPGTFTLVEAGDDGTFGTGDDVTVPLNNVEARDNATLVQLTTDPLPVGSYQIRVNARDVTDRFNNPLGTGVVTSGFMVKNFVPVTITFNAGSGTPHNYTEQGLTVTSGQDHIHLEYKGTDGTTALLNHNSCCSTPYTFSMGGEPFSVVSMDVVGDNKRSGPGLGHGTFTSSTGATATPTALGTFTFDTSGWTNITSFTWDQPSGDLVIDNLVLAVVPGQ
jgi:hypothetical protein